ncbi:MAG TPA: hypothetical protein VMU95_11295 [Trebonia sp.]|nr:hypothetical protein [Trebonia sp.]
MDWYLSLPAAEAAVSCGGGTHTVRWAAGRFEFPAHPDMEAERVLAALGGDKARCVEAAETWARHADDLDVLVSGPRSAADVITLDWDDAEQYRAGWLGLPPGLMGGGGRVMRGAGGLLGPGGGARRAGLQRKLGVTVPEDLLRRVQGRIEVLQLLALGPAFQFRLAGTVTAAWAAGSRSAERAQRQPELTAALTGRAAPAIAEWMGITPDAVLVAPLERPEGPGSTPAPPSWGSLDVLGHGANRLVRGSLPVDWLPRVWACGLALVDSHLVVAVEKPGWPRARVLALPTPGATPVSLDVIGTYEGPVPRWTRHQQGPSLPQSCSPASRWYRKPLAPRASPRASPRKSPMLLIVPQNSAQSTACVPFR